jgi:hypothetical protein
MAHGFVNGVGKMNAAAQALRAIGGFLNEKLAGARGERAPSPTLVTPAGPSSDDFWQWFPSDGYSATMC